jgi:ribosomal protein S18 acetylase RimI-like enzyme
MPPARDAMTLTVTLRRATEEDGEFLCAVYRSTREPELDLVPWDEPTKAAFIAQQFGAQDHAWSLERPGATRQVVLVDGAPAGRIYVDRTPEEVRVVDIALLPEHRGRGVGEVLLRPIIAEAERAGLPVTIHVERHNPALRLYERLGFEVVDDLGVYLFLRRPSAQAKTAS